MGEASAYDASVSAMDHLLYFRNFWLQAEINDSIRLLE